MTNQIHFEVFGNLGKITLNRPKALNALTTEMCKAMIKVMVAWEDDDRIGAVLVEGAGDRAFCAGGDIIMLHDSAKAGDARGEQFWRTEYALNELIHRYKKPYIAMIDGIVMGGGVGLSVHGRLRVAGDNTLFAMPETGIGYFPDVGGTYFLPRLGRDIGNWLGLTGARLKTDDVCALGIANGYVPSIHHAALSAALGKTHLDGSDSAVANILMRFVKKPPEASSIPITVSNFAHNNIADIMLALEQDGGEWAQKQLKLLSRTSPLAQAITLEALRRGANMNFRNAMRQELDLSLNFLDIPDFVEGVRAAVIDKDRQPNWQAASFKNVNQSDVLAAFTRAKSPLTFLN